LLLLDLSGASRFIWLAEPNGEHSAAPFVAGPQLDFHPPGPVFECQPAARRRTVPLLGPSYQRISQSSYDFVHQRIGDALAAQKAEAIYNVGVPTHVRVFCDDSLAAVFQKKFQRFILLPVRISAPPRTKTDLMKKSWSDTFVRVLKASGPMVLSMILHWSKIWSIVSSALP
jgi:hypothetical protein